MDSEPPSPSMRRPERSEYFAPAISATSCSIVSAVDSTAPRQRVAAEGAEAHHAHLGGLALEQGEPLVVDHDQDAVALDDRARLGEVQVRDRDVLALDVLPDIELGPVGQREDPHRLARRQLRVRGAPELGSLLARIPLVPGLAQAEDALLGAAALLVAPGTADGRVEPVAVDALAQGDGLHQARVLVRAVGEGRDALLDRREVLGDPQVEPELGGPTVAELDHLAELPARVDVHDRERDGCGGEGLDGQVQQDRGVLADAVEQHRVLERRRRLPVDVDRLGLELVEDGVVGHRRDRRGGGHDSSFLSSGGVAPLVRAATRELQCPRSIAGGSGGARAVRPRSTPPWRGRPRGCHRRTWGRRRGPRVQRPARRACAARAPRPPPRPQDPAARCRSAGGRSSP